MMFFDDDTPEAAPESTPESASESAPESAPESATELGQQVIELVADQLSEKIENISPASRFQDDLKADSLDLVELVMTFEDNFGISVPDEDYEKILSVGDAITYIEGKMGE